MSVFERCDRNLYPVVLWTLIKNISLINCLEYVGKVKTLFSAFEI